MKGYKKAVIALSLHEETDQILLKQAVERLSPQTQLHLLHATEYMVSYEAAFGVNGGVDTESLLREEAQNYLQRVAEQHGLQNNIRVVLLGPAPVSVVNYAIEEAIDLIVVGNHPQHGLKLLQGSTSSAVLHRAKCDVLALHLPE